MTDGSENKAGLNLEGVRCPECDELMPALRVPESLHQLMWGGWACPKCGCRMDKWGKALSMKRPHKPFGV